MKSSGKTIKRLAAIVFIGIVLFLGGRFFVFWRLEKRIVRHFEALQAEGNFVQYQSLHVNSWKAGLQITELEIRLAASDTACASRVRIPELIVEGISILPLIFEDNLSLKSIFLKYPSIRYARRFNLATAKQGKKGFLNELKINHLQIESCTMEFIDSLTCERKVNTSLDFEMNQLTFHRLRHDSMTWSAGNAKATALTIDLPSHFYGMTLKRIAYSRDDKSIKLDSLQLTPTVNRAEFAKKSGHQVDQFTFVLPALEVNGFEMGPAFQPSFSAKQIALHFQLIVFRDKRIPRAKGKPKVLPVRFLRQLPYRLEIDSIKISPSFISYEEFPEGGDSPGKIFFNDLKAIISNVSNDSSREAQMHVTSRFMNAGEVRASFTFPLKSKMPYSVNGTLTNFSMPEINGILTSIGNVKIESGKMNEMKFKFRYNDYRSEGELQVNYSDLKVLSLRNDPLQTTNKFVSWLLQAFFKKHIDKTDSKDKTTGIIQWERDAQKSIFYYWWKSILSGIKDVYNLDRLTHKKEKEKSK